MSTDLFEGLNGRDIIGARATASHHTVTVTKPHQFPGLGWLRRRSSARPGSRMIATATLLLFLLGGGLLGVSLAAQYKYLLRERHQHAASLVEALALDVGMLIFSLLALGLARAGKTARAERALILACAGGSAAMNLAAASIGSFRSDLAYAMPPVFLAVVADRVISVVRRHFLADEERSAWVAAGTAAAAAGRIIGRSVLYVLRFAVAAPSTYLGARQALLEATPLGSVIEPAPAVPAIDAAALDYGPLITDGLLRLEDLASRLQKPEDTEPNSESEGRGRQPREGTKTARFLLLVAERHGDPAQIALSDVAAIAGEVSQDAGLNAGSARTVLRAAVLAAKRLQEDQP